MVVPGAAVAVSKPRWLSRHIQAPGPPMILCLSQAEMLRVQKRLSGVTPKPSDWPKCGACVLAYDSLQSHERACVVCVSEDAQRRQADDPTWLVAQLVHEAVHVAQHHFEALGDEKPSWEAMAYAVQYISAYLIEEYSRRTHTTPPSTQPTAP